MGITLATTDPEDALSQRLRAAVLAAALEYERAYGVPLTVREDGDKLTIEREN